MYGDFGRYVMGSAVHQFVDPAKINPDAPTHYLRYPEEDDRRARRYIWSRVIGLGWSPDLFKEFESHLGWDGRQQPSVERIGKKYQWIGLFEYLGYLSDHRKYRTWGDEFKDSASAWELTQRDFNPASAVFNLDKNPGDESTGLLAEQAGSPVHRFSLLRERVEWVASKFESFDRYLHASVAGEPRLVLYGHMTFNEQLDFGLTKGTAEHAGQWVDVRSFIVPSRRVPELTNRLQQRTFWGRGCDLPGAYECWPSEYPWHEMLDAVDRACSEGYPWLSRDDGPLHATACELASDSSRFCVPSPGLVRELSHSKIGPLSAVQQDNALGLRIDAASGKSIFWGTTGGPQLLVTDFELFTDWLKEKEWSLVWCVLSERRAMRGYEYTAMQSHQSMVYVLRPDGKLGVFPAKREEWVNDAQQKAASSTSTSKFQA